MSLFTRKLLVLTLVALAVLAPSMTPAAAQDEGKPDSKEEKADERFARVTDWLVLGPVAVPLPAFHDESKKKFDAAWLLGYNHLDPARIIPVESGAEGVPGFGEAIWSIMPADTAGVALTHEGSAPGVTWMAAWVEVPRWMKIDLKASSSDPFEIFIDGKSIVKSTKGGGKEKSGDAKLEKGKHLILAKTVYIPADTARTWNLDAKIAAGKDFDATPVVSLDPTAGMTLAQVMDVPGAGGIDVSPDGSLVKINISRMTPPEGKRERWIEIRSLPKGDLVNRIMDTQIGSTQWIPGTRKISYVSGGRFRVLDIDTGSTETLVEDLGKDFGGYDWSPKGDWIIYSMNKSPKRTARASRDTSGYTTGPITAGQAPPSISCRYRAASRDRSPPASTALTSMTSIPTATGSLSAAGGRISTERPFGTTELLLMDLRDQSVEQLFEGHWLGSAQWSPDGDKLLITAGPSTFGDIGRDLPEGVIPNDYDSQIYIFDPETKKVESITRDFDPAVNRAIWAKFDKKIYIVASDTEFVKLFRYDLKKAKFTELDLGVDVIRSGDIAETKPVGVFTGSGATHPLRVYSVELKSSKPKVRMIDEPGAEFFRHVKLGKVDPWHFKSSTGLEIVGRVHYPPDFDPEKTYPCIVYYYGGTSPVDRTFGGRYPEEPLGRHGLCRLRDPAKRRHRIRAGVVGQACQRVGEHRRRRDHRGHEEISRGPPVCRPGQGRLHRRLVRRIHDAAARHEDRYIRRRRLACRYQHDPELLGRGILGICL